MLPVIALVGRPNVGKSTLFNRLTRTRDALVADEPGLTRDRIHGIGEAAGHRFIVVDTGGIGAPDASAEIDTLMTRQMLLAVEEADAVVFLVDAHAGLSPADEDIAARLRGLDKPVVVAANKAEGLAAGVAEADFHALGFAAVQPISAERGSGVSQLLADLASQVPAFRDAGDGELAEDPNAIRVAVVGRPNVGKSTLVNRLLGEERVLAYDQPGTTRDTIRCDLTRDAVHYVLMDTAGIRRRSRVADRIEKFSVVKTLQAIEAAHVVVLMLDAQQGVSAQDASLLGMILEQGRALVIAVNKWDGLQPERRREILERIDYHFHYVRFAHIRRISALHGTGVGELLDDVRVAHESAGRHLPTSELNQVLQQAVRAHEPPLSRGRRVKLRYAHQGGRFPPSVIIHGTQTDALSDAYRRYLENTIREHFGLVGTPVTLSFRTTPNPYEGKKNVLTPRQVEKRKRLKRHVKRRKP